MDQHSAVCRGLSNANGRPRVVPVFAAQCIALLPCPYDYSCDFPRFNYFSIQIAKFSHQIANRIVAFQTESSHLKLNCQNGSNRDLNPNRDWALPINGIDCNLRSRVSRNCRAVNCNIQSTYLNAAATVLEASTVID